MSMNIVSRFKGHEFDIPYVVYYKTTVATPKTALAKMYEEKNEMLLKLKVPKANYKEPFVQELLKWGNTNVRDESYYRDIAIHVEVMGGFEQTVAFTHASIVTKVEADTEGDMVIIFVTANQKRDKFVGVMFGDTLEETCQKALKRVNNPPRINIVIPVIKQNNDNTIDLNFLAAKYMSDSNNTSIVEYVKAPNKITANFQINGKEKFKAETTDLNVFKIIGNGFQEFKPGDKIYIKDLLEQGYRPIESSGSIHTYNKKPIKIYKEENGESKKIGDGYDVYDKPYSIDYKNLLKELGYTVNTLTDSELSRNVGFFYKDGTMINILKVDVSGYGIKGVSIINNITIEEIENKTVFDKFYDLENGIVTFTTGSSDKIAYEIALVKAVRLTTAFEGGGVTGNFDGQGLSMGILQFNFGQKSLQPLLSEMNLQHNELMKNIFGSNYNKLDTVLKSSYSEQMQWVISINDNENKIMEPWKSAFTTLNNSVEFNSVQINSDTFQLYGNQAKSIVNTYELKTERGVVLAFDIAVQNWSTDGNDTFIKEVLAMTNELDKLRKISDRVINKSTYKDDVKSRKYTIVNGKGKVHRIDYDLSNSEYDILDRVWY